MKPSELKTKSAKELTKITDELREELFRLKFRLATGELAQNTNIRKAKKNLARVLTILNAGAKS